VTSFAVLKKLLRLPVVYLQLTAGLTANQTRYAEDGYC